MGISWESHKEPWLIWSLESGNFEGSASAIWGHLAAYLKLWASLVVQIVKNWPAMQETQVWSLGRKDPLEKEMATHFSVLAWRIPWTEVLDGLYNPWGVWLHTEIYTCDNASWPLCWGHLFIKVLYKSTSLCSSLWERMTEAPKILAS